MIIVPISPYVSPGIRPVVWGTFKPPKFNYNAVTVSPQEIIRILEDSYGLNRGVLCAGNRKRAVVECRHMAVYIISFYHYQRWQLTEISRILNKDHTTIIHAKKALQDRLDTEPALRDRLQELLTILRNKG